MTSEANEKNSTPINEINISTMMTEINETISRNMNNENSSISTENSTVKTDLIDTTTYTDRLNSSDMNAYTDFFNISTSMAYESKNFIERPFYFDDYVPDFDDTFTESTGIFNGSCEYTKTDYPFVSWIDSVDFTKTGCDQGAAIFKINNFNITTNPDVAVIFFSSICKKFALTTRASSFLDELSLFRYDIQILLS